MSQAVLKSSLSMALRATGTDRLIGAVAGVRRQPLIIGYHRVIDTLASDHPGATPAMTVSVRMMEQHLDWIGRRYRFLSLDEVGARIAAGSGWSKPVAAITFDDGYSDVYHHALPVLLRKGIPAAVFLVTDTVGTSHLHTHDRLYLLLMRRWPRAKTLVATLSALREDDARVRTPFAATRFLLGTRSQHQLARIITVLETDHGPAGQAPDALRPLTWEMVAEMHRHGVTVGSHTRTHPVLTNEDEAHQLHELVTSREIIEERLSSRVRHFAYPDGAFDDTIVRIVDRAGYDFAYTACRHQVPAYPNLTIARRFLWENSCLDASGRFSPSVMSCLVNGVYDLATTCPYRQHASPLPGWRTRHTLAGRATE